MKFKLGCLLSLFISAFIIFSCNKNNNDPYKDKILKDSPAFKLENSIVTEYDVSNGSLPINIGNLIVKFNGNNVEYFDSDESLVEKGKDKYFITLSNTSPTINRIKHSDKMSTNNNKYSLDVYVGMIDSSSDKLYISNPIAITLKNSKALNPILYYVGGAVIIVAVAVLGFVAKKYKETH